MQTGFLDLLIGFFVAILGILGLFLASGAHDTAIHWFGMALFIFAVLFVFYLIKAHFDGQPRADRT